MQHLIGIFCSPTTGLGSIGLEVGPAIPIDILQYAAQRHNIAQEQGEPVSAAQTMREGLEMYLFPQFEGRDTDHQEIVAVIGRVLALGEERDQIDRRLAVWTGFEPGHLEP